MSHNRRNLEFDRLQAEFDRRQSFITGAMQDLVDRTSTLDQIKQREIWRELEPGDRGALLTLSKAVQVGDAALVNLIIERSRRPMPLIRLDSNQVLEKWIERAGGKTALKLLRVLMSASFVMGWERDSAMGLTSLQDYQYSVIQETRQNLVELVHDFQAQHPDPEPVKARAAARRDESRSELVGQQSQGI